jgi:hypothetical protein
MVVPMRLKIKSSRLILTVVLLQAMAAKALMADCCVSIDPSPPNLCFEDHASKSVSVPALIPSRCRLSKTPAESPDTDAVAARKGTDVSFAVRNNVQHPVFPQSFPSPVHFLVLRI